MCGERETSLSDGGRCERMRGEGKEEEKAIRVKVYRSIQTQENGHLDDEMPTLATLQF